MSSPTYSLTIQKTWNVNGVPTNPTSITIEIVENDNSAVIVAPGTAMTQVATGVYQYTVPSVNGGTTYTATITVVYAGQTYTFSIVAVPSVAAESIEWPHGFKTLLDQLMSLYAQVTLSPKPTYQVEEHSYSWNEYLRVLGEQIEQMTKLRAQAHPFEVVSTGN